MSNDKAEATGHNGPTGYNVHPDQEQLEQAYQFGARTGRVLLTSELAKLEPVPTQVRRPWRSTARTLFQALVAMAVLFPILVDQTGLNPDDAPWLAIPLAVAAAVTRIMALPQVENFLARFLPFLAAAPQSPAPPAEETPDTEDEE